MVEFEDLGNRHDCTNNSTAGGVHGEADAKSRARACCCDAGHEDWLLFSSQSKVAYTPFGSARRYQPALSNLLLVRVDEMNAVRVVTQTQLDEFAASNQIL